MIVLGEGALAYLERIFEFNFAGDPVSASTHIDGIRAGVLILDEHPEIGRRFRPGSLLRELVISYGKGGYMALYEFSPSITSFALLRSATNGKPDTGDCRQVSQRCRISQHNRRLARQHPTVAMRHCELAVRNLPPAAFAAELAHRFNEQQ